MLPAAFTSIQCISITINNDQQLEDPEETVILSFGLNFSMSATEVQEGFMFTPSFETITITIIDDDGEYIHTHGIYLEQHMAVFNIFQPIIIKSVHSLL